MSPVGPLRRALLVLLGLTLAVAVGFITVIVSGFEGGVEVHELAGLILLVLLGLGVWAASRLRPADGRPLWRVSVALAAVMTAAVLGGALGTGLLPLALAGLPLVPLVVVVAAAADGIRVTYALPPPRSDLRA